MLLLIAGAASGGWWYFKLRSASPVPANITQAAGFTLYYPKKLPSGYRLDKQSFKISNGVVFYDASDNSGDRLIFSLQSKPSTIDFSNFYQAVLDNAKSFNTATGQAAIGTINGKILGSLLAGQTWILVSSNTPDFSRDFMALVLNNMASN